MSTADNNNNSNPPKPGVASLEELTAMVSSAGDALVVIDVRNPDASVEPGDQKSLAVAGLPSSDGETQRRPQAKHLIWDRTTNSMPLGPLEGLPKDTPIITHCGGGGRGQLAKEYLEQQAGFTNVLNGAGPKEKDLWAIYGDK
jgi:rhodanese-related sulfurtransferase